MRTEPHFQIFIEYMSSKTDDVQCLVCKYEHQSTSVFTAKNGKHTHHIVMPHVDPQNLIRTLNKIETILCHR